VEIVEKFCEEPLCRCPSFELIPCVHTIDGQQETLHLCKVCYALWSNIVTSPTWRKLHEEWLIEQKRRKGLRSGADYLK
jgi:hypothetical protein